MQGGAATGWRRIKTENGNVKTENWKGGNSKFSEFSEFSDYSDYSDYSENLSVFRFHLSACPLRPALKNAKYLHHRALIRTFDP